MNVFCFILYILSFINLTKVYTANQAKKKAEKSYTTHSYKESASYLHTLVDSLQIKDDNAIIDLAHTYYQIRDNKKAENYYSKSANSSNPKIKSIASNQLGVLAYNEKENEKALAYFKSALQADPTNEKARYNYELLKKENEQNQSDKNEDKNKDQENKDNSKNQDQNNKDKDQNQSSKKDQEKNKKDKQNKSGSEQKDKKEKEKQEQSVKNNKQQEDKKDKQNSTENKSEKENNEKEKKELAKQLQQLNLTEEKATSILDAMKNNETQYLQQKKKQTKEPTPNNKPTW